MCFNVKLYLRQFAPYIGTEVLVGYYGHLVPMTTNTSILHLDTQDIKFQSNYKFHIYEAYLFSSLIFTKSTGGGITLTY